jgi:hypothetical protein
VLVMEPRAFLIHAKQVLYTELYPQAFHLCLLHKPILAPNCQLLAYRGLSPVKKFKTRILSSDAIEAETWKVQEPRSIVLVQRPSSFFYNLW